MEKETAFAIYSYPHLESQWKQWTAFKKQIPRENLWLHAYVQDILGMTELRIAFAKAIIVKEYTK